jgi:TPR repeat protein
MLHRGEKIPQNLIEAIYWYGKAIAQQHMSAMGNLADLVNSHPKRRVVRSISVMSAPDSNSHIIRKLSDGDLVYPVQPDAQWTAVILDDRRTLGWVSSASL